MEDFGFKRIGDSCFEMIDPVSRGTWRLIGAPELTFEVALTHVLLKILLEGKRPLPEAVGTIVLEKAASETLEIAHGVRLKVERAE